MTSLNCYSYLIGTLRGKKYEFGSLSTPVVLTAAGDDVLELTKTVAVSTSALLWDPTVSATTVGDFDVLVMASDFDLDYEFTINTGGGTVRLQTGELLGSGTAGTYGQPLILTSDRGWDSAYTSDWGAGAADVIDRIRVRNQSATNTAQVILLLFT